MRRQLVVTAIVGLLLVLGASVAVARAEPKLRAESPTSVTGTDATAVFQIADRTIRQIRYVDRGTLTYSFWLANDGSLPVTVTGLDPGVDDPRLFDYVSLVDGDGDERFTVGAGDSVAVDLSLRMTGCESLSARAGSFVTDVRVLTSTAMGVGKDSVTVALPEEVRTGSPREAACARASATSRPAG